MKRFALVPISFVVLGLASCSTMKSGVDKFARAFHIIEHVEVKEVPVNAPPEYRQALQSLAAGQFEQASQQLDAFLKANPASPWTQAATLNSGRALEGLEEWSDASERYHSVVRATPEAKKLQAMALYRLSVCEEALGDDQQVVAVLNDLLPRSSELPPETAAAELPARLASAYARVGIFDRALDFYRKAENGIAKLRQAAGDKVPEWLPRTLFDMGAMSRHKPAWDEFEISLRPLARGQVYLLQAAELQVEPWATQAADEIIATYNSLWNVVASAAPERGGDPVLAKRALQLRQWDRAILLLDNLAELRARATIRPTCCADLRAKGRSPTLQPDRLALLLGGSA